MSLFGGIHISGWLWEIQHQHSLVGRCRTGETDWGHRWTVLVFTRWALLTEESPGGWWKMTTSMIAEVSFRNRLMFSNWKGTDAENAIGWFWRCYQWQFFSSTRHRRRNRLGLGTTAHPDICRGLCSPGDSSQDLPSSHRTQDRGSKLQLQL